MASSLLLSALKEAWGNIVFSRVTNIVLRAHDLSLWLPREKCASTLLPMRFDTPDHSSYEKNDNRIYLGDNRCIIETLPLETQKWVEWEYDYFYGFSRGVGTGDTVHFASPNHAKIDFENGSPLWVDSIIMNPPRRGNIVCGVVEKTDKGLTFKKWWSGEVVHEFFELCKIVKTSHFLRDEELSKIVRRLSGPPGFYEHIFQAIAVRCIFGKSIPPRLKESLPKIQSRSSTEENNVDVFFIDAFCNKLLHFSK